MRLSRMRMNVECMRTSACIGLGLCRLGTRFSGLGWWSCLAMVTRYIFIYAWVILTPVGSCCNVFHNSHFAGREITSTEHGRNVSDSGRVLACRAFCRGCGAARARVNSLDKHRSRCVLPKHHCHDRSVEHAIIGTAEMNENLPMC